jgi:hypothetical protein
MTDTIRRILRFSTFPVAISAIFLTRLTYLPIGATIVMALVQLNLAALIWYMTREP